MTIHELKPWVFFAFKSIGFSDVKKYVFCVQIDTESFLLGLLGGSEGILHMREPHP